MSNTNDVDEHSAATDCSTDIRPIRTLLNQLNDEEFQLAGEVLLSFLQTMQEFPKPVGTKGVTMSATELERYYDGWDAAIEASAFTTSMFLGIVDQFLESRSP